MSIAFDCQIKENQIQITNLLFHFHFLMWGDVGQAIICNIIT